MTIGIYSITVPGYSNKTYIGRSVDMEKRWLRHEAELKKGIHHNKKLQAVYKRFKGRSNFKLVFALVEECVETDLKSLEQAACDLIPRSKQFNTFKGVDDYYALHGWKKKLAKRRKASGRKIK